MSSSITLYDDAGNPVVISGEALKKGLATAWVNFDGVTGTIKSSYNVDSVTRREAGKYTLHFTDGAFDNSDYVVTTNSPESLNSDVVEAFGVEYAVLNGGSPTNKTTTELNVFNNYNGTANNDKTDFSVVIHGGKN